MKNQPFYNLQSDSCWNFVCLQKKYLMVKFTNKNKINNAIFTVIYI